MSVNCDEKLQICEVSYRSMIHDKPDQEMQSPDHTFISRKIRHQNLSLHFSAQFPHFFFGNIQARGLRTLAM